MPEDPSSAEQRNTQLLGAAAAMTGGGACMLAASNASDVQWIQWMFIPSLLIILSGACLLGYATKKQRERH